jgi:PAS domain S-box-containing protein
MKQRFFQSISVLKSKQLSEIKDSYKAKIQVVSSLLKTYEDDLKQLSLRHQQEKSNLEAVHAKELHDAKLLEDKRRDIHLKNEEMKAIMEAMLDPMIVSDEVGVMKSVNDAALKVFGYAAEEMVGKNVKMIVDPELQSKHDSFLYNYRTTRKAKVIGTVGRRVRGLRKDGALIPLHLSVSESVIDGKTYFIACLHDLQDTENSEKLLKSSIEEATKQANKYMCDITRLVEDLEPTLRLIYDGLSSLEKDDQIPNSEKELLLTLQNYGANVLKRLHLEHME